MTAMHDGVLLLLDDDDDDDDAGGGGGGDVHGECRWTITNIGW